MKFIETKSDRKPLRRRWQTLPGLGRVLQLCKSVATFPQLLNHLHQTLQKWWENANVSMAEKSIIHSPLQGRAGSGEMTQSERARAWEHVEVRAKPFTIMWVTGWGSVSGQTLAVTAVSSVTEARWGNGPLAAACRSR